MWIQLYYRSGDVSTLIEIDPLACTGCRACETACSYRESTQPLRPEVLVQDEGYSSLPVICCQCSEASCERACATRAITRDRETGALRVNRAKCFGCGLCTLACPFGTIWLDRARKMASKCDLCGGQPRCAGVCLNGAISIIPRNTVSADRLARLRKRLDQVVITIQEVDTLEAPYALPGCLYAEAEVVERSGVRAVLTFEATERVSPANAELAPHENAGFIKRQRERGCDRVQGMMCVQTTFSCMPPFLLRAKALARDLSTSIQVHLSEGPDESRVCLERYGKLPVELYEDIGFLDEDVMAARGPGSA